MSTPGDSNSLRDKVNALLEQLKAVEASLAATPGYVLRAKRSEILDELQDAVGLSGKMVTESDILKRAAQIASA